MSGETEANVSGWTTDTLKEYFEAMVKANADLSQARLNHLLDMRRMDSELRLAKEKYDDTHFAQLNENAKRTIEERGHFVSIEAFQPFQRQVLDALASGIGQKAGAREVLGYLLGASGVIIAAVALLTR